MEKELSIFEAKMRRYEAYTKTITDHVDWRFHFMYGAHRGIFDSLEKKIENKNRIIAKLQSSLRNIYKEKEALAKAMKEKVEAKEDDDDTVMNLKLEICVLNEEIIRLRNKAIDKGRGMIDKQLQLEKMVSKHSKEEYGDPADLPPISDADIEISDVEYKAQAEAKSDEEDPYDEDAYESDEPIIGTIGTSSFATRTFRRGPFKATPVQAESVETDETEKDETEEEEAEPVGADETEEEEAELDSVESSSVEDETDDDNDDQEEIF